jgi:hypothetical protein
MSQADAIRFRDAKIIRIERFDKRLDALEQIVGKG